MVPPGDAKPRRWPRFTAEGHTLALELWDRLDPKPIAGFGPFRERLSQCLSAGYTEEALRRVAGHVEVWSRAGIEMAFRAWEALSADVRASAEAEVRREHPRAAAWGEGVHWRALVVAAAERTAPA